MNKNEWVTIVETQADGRSSTYSGWLTRSVACPVTVWLDGVIFSLGSYNGRTVEIVE